MRLRDGARVAVIGAGPSGLVAAKHALEAGFEPTVLEAGDALGAARRRTAACGRGSHEHQPRDDRVLGLPRARSGRFRRPQVPDALRSFGGELLHAFDYPGAEPLAGRRTLVYGNGISGLEIASDLAPHAPGRVPPGDATLPADAEMRRVIAQPRPPLDAHNGLALTLAEQLGVSPEPVDWPELAESLMFGPLLPPRYRLCGPGAAPGTAATRFAEQLAASPRSPVDPADVGALRAFGREATADAVASVAA